MEESKQESIDSLSTMGIQCVPHSLVYQSQQGNEAAVRLLINAGLSPNTKSWAKDVKGKDAVYLPLHSAITNGQVGIIRMLIQAGADLEYQDKDFDLPLVLAINQNQNEIALILIDAKADPNATNKDGANMLYLARKKGLSMAVDALVKAGAREMTEAEIRTYKNKQAGNMAVGLAFIVVIILVGFFGIKWLASGITSSSNSSSSIYQSKAQHTCMHCHKSYTGYGWMTINGEQYQPEKDYGDQYCSKSCAYESQPYRWENAR